MVKGEGNWTPEGFIGQLFRVISAQVPPPVGAPPPVLSGTEPRIVELFGTSAEDIRCTRRHFVFRCRSPAHWIDVFRNFYGPMPKAYATLDATGQERLRGNIATPLERLNVGGTDPLVVPGDYLEGVVTRL